MHPKIVIINYYDSLISDLDIYVEEFLKSLEIEKSSGGEDDALLGIENKRQSDSNESDNENDNLVDYSFDQNQIVNLFEKYNDEYVYEDNVEEDISKITSKRDYFNLIRSKAIAEIRKIQKYNLDSLKIDSSSNWAREDLFGNKYCFLIKMESFQYDLNFKMLTIVVDFYLDQDECDYLK